MKIPHPGPPSLSAPVPVPDNYPIKGGLLLHKLLFEGKGDEVLRRKSELNPDLLSRTFTHYHTQEVRNRLRLRPMQFPVGISIDLLVWLFCRVSCINNNMISG